MPRVNEVSSGQGREMGRKELLLATPYAVLQENQEKAELITFLICLLSSIKEVYLHTGEEQTKMAKRFVCFT